MKFLSVKNLIHCDRDVSWQFEVSLLEGNQFFRLEVFRPEFLLYKRFLLWKIGWKMYLLSPVSVLVTNFSVSSCRLNSSDRIAGFLHFEIAGLNCSDPHFRMVLRVARVTSRGSSNKSVQKSSYFSFI